MGRLTENVFQESCCDGMSCPDPTGDSRSLADQHAIEHAESINLTPRKMGWTRAQTPNAEQDQTEIRVTDPQTGGQKGSKLQRYDLIPPEFLYGLATHYGKGAQKYDDRNWERGYKWGLSYAALMRHLEAWRMGETEDPETGSNHLIAAAWHCAALLVFQTRGLGTDDLRVVK